MRFHAGSIEAGAGALAAVLILPVAAIGLGIGGYVAAMGGDYVAGKLGLWESHYQSVHKEMKDLWGKNREVFNRGGGIVFKAPWAMNGAVILVQQKDKTTTANGDCYTIEARTVDPVWHLKPGQAVAVVPVPWTSTPEAEQKYGLGRTEYGPIRACPVGNNVWGFNEYSKGLAIKSISYG